MNQPRVLYVVTGREYGGAVKHVCQLIEGAAERNYEVAVMAGGASELREVCTRHSFRYEYNPFFTHSVGLKGLLRDIISVVPLLNICHSFRPHLISAHGSKTGVIARVTAAVYRIPVVYTVHGWGFRDRRSSWNTQVLEILERFLAQFTSQFICVSYSDQKVGVHKGIGSPDQYTTIHNGIPSSDSTTRNHPDNANCTCSEFDHLNSPLIVGVGRLAPPKDWNTLLTAFDQVEIGSLLLVGDGPQRSSLEGQIQHLKRSADVSLLGHRTDVLHILKHADIFVLSSHKEGCPYSILEAMRTRTPVVASAVGGVPELVRDQMTGLLVAPGAVEDLAAALTTLARNAQLRQRMGSAGFRRLEARFTVSQMLERTFQIYDSYIPDAEEA